MICANCGAQNAAGQRFCDNCGQPLSANCPNCGAATRPGARFCGNCGTSLSDEQPATAPTVQSVPAEIAERRLVSVLFADLVGFTPFAEEKDPEEVRETLQRYFDTARTVIERHGGTVEKFIGDAVMAVWGTPIAREDDAERAVRAALELLPAVRGVDDRLQARAAVLSGEAAVGVGAGDQGMVAGDLVNTAARLQSVAQSGTVLVGESTMRAASAAIAFEQVGEQALKGKASPVPAWRALRVVADRGGRTRSDSLEPPFVGRDAELTLLKDLLHATSREGRARLVAVTGPAGIGKSRLAWELEKYVDGLVEDVYWHRGRSPSYGEGIAFWALGEMVRRRAGLAESDDEPTTRQRIGQAVADYVPDEADRRWVEPALLALLGVEPAPAGGRDMLFAAWRIFFERIAGNGTTILLFEDLQFADSGLLDFIDHLLEWSKNSPIMVLALARPELLERRPEFGSATRHFHSLPLEPLSDEHMRELLGGLVPDLDPRAAASIIGRADGIPLYAVETIRMLVADGRLEARDDGTCKVLRELGELAIPDTLRSLIASRLDALDAADRSLLQHASILGQSFTMEALAAISGSAADELSARLRSMVRREILAVEADPRSPERGQYRFVQGLIREVAYGTLSRRERRERHLAAARHYEAVGDDETAGALASHYLAAHEASDAGPEADAVATQARLALRGAAERASTLGAHDEAIAHLERALAVTTDDAERADLLERAARAARARARYDDGMRLARLAIEAYAGLDDRQAVGRLSGLLGEMHVDASRHGEAIELFQAALADVPAEARELRAALNAHLSRAYMRSRHDREAIAAADVALEIAEPAGMTAVIAEALINKGSSMANIGRWREGSALVATAAPLAQSVGDGELHLRALNNVAASIGDDDPGHALVITSEALAMARRLGLRGMVNWLTGTVAGFRYWTGRDWDVAIAELEEAVEDAGNDSDRARLLAHIFGFMIARGEADEAQLEHILSVARSTDDPVYRAGLTSLRGDMQLARGDARSAVAAYRQAALLDPLDLNWPESLLRAAVWLGDHESARDAVEMIERHPSSGRVATTWRSWGPAMLAALAGQRKQAIVGLKAGNERASEIGIDFDIARVALDALILLPDEPEVRAMAQAARSTFEATRARTYLDRLDAELSRAAAVTSPAAGRSAPAEEHPAEAEVDQR